jgi:predicted TIM-barrel fold metal-dependent hydrolase
MRAVSSIERPTFEVPAGACDAHMHVFGPEDRYPRVPHPHYTLPDGTMSHFRALIDALGIDHFVIVQPSFYDTDNSCLLDALADVGDVARGVVMVEPDIGDDELTRMNALGVRGVRLDLFKRAHLPMGDIQAFITTMVEKVRPFGWHLQFYAPGYVVRDLIAFLGTIEIDFVIDHMGYMLEEDGLTDADFQRLLALLRSGRCWLKLSAPYRLAKKRGYEPVHEVARAIVAAAPRQALWGSDWPHIPLSADHDTGALLNMLALWAPEPEIRNMILADNPRRLFGFA